MELWLLDADDLLPRMHTDVNDRKKLADAVTDLVQVTGARVRRSVRSHGRLGSLKRVRRSASFCPKRERRLELVRNLQLAQHLVENLKSPEVPESKAAVVVAETLAPRLDIEGPLLRRVAAAAVLLVGTEVSQKVGQRKDVLLKAAIVWAKRNGSTTRLSLVQSPPASLSRTVSRIRMLAERLGKEGPRTGRDLRARIL